MYMFAFAGIKQFMAKHVRELLSRVVPNWTYFACSFRDSPTAVLQSKIAFARCEI